jgi:hypothetical protein
VSTNMSLSFIQSSEWSFCIRKFMKHFMELRILFKYLHWKIRSFIFGFHFNICFNCV